MRKGIAACVAVFAILGPARQSWAQAIQNVVLRNSFNPVGAGARGLGMGGAFIAVADDGTAASFNPAGLAQLRRTEIALVGFADRLQSTVELRGVDEGTTQRSTRHGGLDFGGISVPFEVASRNLTVNVSYQRTVDMFGEGRAAVVDTYTLVDLGIDSEGTADFIGDIEPKQRGAFHTASLATGYELSSHLSLGLGVTYWISEWTVSGTSVLRGRIKIPGEPPTPDFVFSRSTFDQDQSFRGLGFSGGILLRYPRLSLGGILRFPFTGDYELRETGTRAETDFDTGGENVTPFDARVVSKMQWPRSAGAGIALRPFKGFTLAADYAKSRWSRIVIENLPDGALLTPGSPIVDANGNTVATFSDVNFFDLLPASQTRTLDTSQWRAGAEYLLTAPQVVFPVRVGLFRDHSPVPQLGREQGRRIDGYTAGLGVNFDRVVLDVAYEHRKTEGVIGLIRGRGTAGSAPTESVKEDRMVVSLIYRFSPGEDPLKRVFKSVFGGE